MTDAIYAVRYGIRELIARETAETYNTPDLRAAYRAGMSSAAAVCDKRAREVSDQNPGRQRNRPSMVGQFGVDIARSCGDAIMAERDLVTVASPVLPKDLENGEKT